MMQASLPEPQIPERRTLILWCSLFSLLAIIFFRSAYIYVPTFLLAFVACSRKVPFGLLSITSGFAMAVIAYNKELVGDAANYLRYFDYSSTLSLSEFLADVRPDFSIRRSEVLFRLYIWCSSALRAPFELFNSITIFGIYVSMIFFGKKIMEALTKPSLSQAASPVGLDRLFLVYWVLLVCVTFSLTSHVIKQYISIAVFCIGLGLSLNPTKGKLSALILIASTLFHNSALILLIIYFASNLFKSYLTKSRMKLAVAVLAAIIGAILPSLLGPLAVILSYGGLEGGHIGPTIFLDAILILSTALITLRRRFNDRMTQLSGFVFLFLCALVLVREVPILFARMYFFMDAIRIICGIVIYRSFFSTDRMVILGMLFILGPVYWTVKLYSSGWGFGWYTSSDFLYRFLGA